MAAVQAGLARGALPDLVDTLFLDVEEAITALRLREALLLVGTVLEIASDQYIERLSGPQDPRIKKVLSDRWVSFGEKRFNRIPKILSNRTLSSDATESFANLDRAYRARNAVAHNGRAVYREGDREIEVDAVTALRFLEAARRAADWLASL